MTTAKTTDRNPVPWYDRVSDWFNAILIKEARQSLKSRQFVGSFMLLLAVAWVVSVFLLLNSGPALEYGDVGRGFFFSFYLVLGFAAIVIVPFSAMRSLISERDLNTFDLLSITSLKPRQIVWGKLLSAGLQLFLFYSAITPFIAFASLMQGFDTAAAAVILIGTMLVSLLLSMAALMLSTFARNRFFQAIATTGAIAGLIWAYGWTVGGVFSALQRAWIDVGDPFFWWGAAFLALASLTYFVLFQQITVAQLTFESDNRSTGVRIVCTAQFWVLWLAVGLFYYVQKDVPDPVVLQILVAFSAIHLAVAGLIFATEGDFLTRRVRRGVPHNRLLRWLVAPFMPGGARGFWLALMHVLALWVIVVAVQGRDGLRPSTLSVESYYRGLTDLQSPTWTQTLRVSTAVCAYVVIYLGIAAALGRWASSISSDARPAHVRVLTVLVLTAGVIFPLVLRATEAVKQPNTVFDVTSPSMTIQYLVRKSPPAQVPFDWSAPRESLNELIRRRGYADVIIVLLMMAAGAAVLVNGAALYRGFRDLQPLRRDSAGNDRAGGGVSAA
ncbi:MAG: ABC transporter permease [Planctomycetaceae bacterium]